MADLEAELRRLRRTVESRIATRAVPAEEVRGQTAEMRTIAIAERPQLRPQWPATSSMEAMDSAELDVETKAPLEIRERVFNANRADLGWLLSLLKDRLMGAIGVRPGPRP